MWPPPISSGSLPRCREAVPVPDRVFIRSSPVPHQLSLLGPYHIFASSRPGPYQGLTTDSLCQKDFTPSRQRQPGLSDAGCTSEFALPGSKPPGWERLQIEMVRQASLRITAWTCLHTCATVPQRAIRKGGSEQDTHGKLFEHVCMLLFGRMRYHDIVQVHR